MSLGFKSTGNYCCAVGCNHKSSKDKCSFFSFPSNTFWRREWIVAVKRLHVDGKGRTTTKLWEPKNHHRLCSCHFSYPPNSHIQKKGWNHIKPDFPERQTTSQQPRRCLNRQISEAAMSTLPVTVGNNDDVDMPMRDQSNMLSEDNECERHGAATAVDDAFEYMREVSHDHDYLHTERKGRLADAIDKLTEQHPEFNLLLDDYSSAKKGFEEFEVVQKKGRILTLNFVKDNSVIFEYYTGLPSYDVFKAIFTYLESKASDMQYASQIGKDHFATKSNKKPGPSRILTLEEEMFITLTRLRLGLPSKDCARRFGIAESTFSNIFNTWCILLSQELEAICVTPSADKLDKCKAPCFSNFSNIRVVLDCTELFSQTPGTLDNHKQQHSSYKHHSTVKFLVGMSPSGAITFISDMWGGRASDKKITCNSTQLLSDLDAGDKVMVDRGFTIAEDLPIGVKLIIPPFKNKVTGQFTAEQLEYSEKISVARIHVERAMRAIKEFRLLETEVKLAMINNYENIFKTCAFLVNFRRPFLKVH